MKNKQVTNNFDEIIADCKMILTRKEGFMLNGIYTVKLRLFGEEIAFPPEKFWKSRKALIRSCLGRGLVLDSRVASS
ncbi:MAG: hypothetical protein NHB15_12835 [Methanosarcina barkeri]|nr:hypothetical protein [Methanosarcina sp. ERenArc_MAG2]